MELQYIGANGNWENYNISEAEWKGGTLLELYPQKMFTNRIRVSVSGGETQQRLVVRELYLYKDIEE